LEQFFLRVRVNAEGVVVVGRQVVEALAEIFETEDKSNPYSDLQIVELLKERGLDIKHRTVTKYRNQLGVPIAKNRQVL
jgi:RNA polymerase sigma-54 factor